MSGIEEKHQELPGQGRGRPCRCQVAVPGGRSLVHLLH